MARKANDFLWHGRRVRQYMQRMLSDGAELEDLMNMAIDSARAEWAARIIVRQPLVIRIDGQDWQWPLGDRGEAADH